MHRLRERASRDYLHARSDAGPATLAIFSWLREARRRYRRGAARRTLVRAAFYCFSAAACGLVAVRALHETGMMSPGASLACRLSPALALGLVAPACFVAWASSYLLTRPTLLRVARQADTHLSLNDMLPTAVECMSGRVTLLSPLLIRDAAARIQGLDPPRMGSRRASVEARLLPFAVAIALAVAALDLAYPAPLSRHGDAAVRQEGEILESTVARLEEALPRDTDTRQARSLLRKAEELARDMRSGAVGAQEAAEGLAGLLEELTLRGLDTKPQPRAGLRQAAQPEAGKAPQVQGRTSVLDYGDDLESVRRDLSSLQGREMSTDETAALAGKLRDLARKVGEDTALGQAAREASEALQSEAGEEEREEAIEQFLSSAELADAGRESTTPDDREAMEELREAMSRAERALKERLSRTRSGELLRSDGGSEELEKGSGGEIVGGQGRSERPGAGQGEGEAAAPGTEPGSRTPGSSAPRPDSLGLVYPTKGLPGAGDIGVTTVLGPGTAGIGIPPADEGAGLEVRVEESATGRERIPADYRAVVERYFE